MTFKRFKSIWSRSKPDSYDTRSYHENVVPWQLTRAEAAEAIVPEMIEFVEMAAKMARPTQAFCKQCGIDYARYIELSKIFKGLD